MRRTGSFLSIAFMVNPLILGGSSATPFQVTYLLLGLLSRIPPADAAYIAFMPQPITEESGEVKESIPMFNCLYGIVMTPLGADVLSERSSQLPG